MAEGTGRSQPCPAVERPSHTHTLVHTAGGRMDAHARVWCEEAREGPVFLCIPSPRPCLAPGPHRLLAAGTSGCVPLQTVCVRGSRAGLRGLWLPPPDQVLLNLVGSEVQRPPRMQRLGCASLGGMMLGPFPPPAASCALCSPGSLAGWLFSGRGGQVSAPSASSCS